MSQHPVAAGSPSGGWALPFSALHLGLRNLLPGQRPQRAGWLAHTLSCPEACRLSCQRLGLAKSDFSLGMSQDVGSGIGEWNPRSADASKCVRTQCCVAASRVCQAAAQKSCC